MMDNSSVLDRMEDTKLKNEAIILETPKKRTACVNSKSENDCEALPLHWIARKSRTYSKFFYYNTVTGQKTWVRPHCTTQKHAVKNDGNIYENNRNEFSLRKTIVRKNKRKIEPNGASEEIAIATPSSRSGSSSSGGSGNLSSVSSGSGSSCEDVAKNNWMTTQSTGTSKAKRMRPE